MPLIFNMQTLIVCQHCLIDDHSVLFWPFVFDWLSPCVKASLDSVAKQRDASHSRQTIAKWEAPGSIPAFPHAFGCTCSMLRSTILSTVTLHLLP